MSEEITVYRGTKINPDETGTLDRSKMEVVTPGMPPVSEVEGQVWFKAHFQCPWCQKIIGFYHDPAQDNWFACEGCGGAFWAFFDDRMKLKIKFDPINDPRFQAAGAA